MKFFTQTALVSALIAFASPAFADCAAPAGPEGGLNYVDAATGYEYCDGTSWVNVSAGGGAGAIDDLTDAISNTTSTVFLGTGSGAASTGTGNTGVGINALASNVAKQENTAVGLDALRYANDSAVAGISYNTALGAYALRGSTTAASNTGTSNVAIGHSVLIANTTGYYNTVVGSRYTMIQNTTGYGNSVFGYAAMFGNIGGTNNTVMGYSTMESNSSGTANTAIGAEALRSNTTKQESTAVGFLAMRYADSAAGAAVTYNTALGAYALRGSTTAADNTGTSNTALGHSALLSNTTGSNNVAIGSGALDLSTVATDLVAIGKNAMGSYATGAFAGTIAIGSGALASQTGGAGNLAIGYNAAESQATADSTTAIGYNALRFNLNHGNTCLGRNCMYSNINGTRNTGIGVNTLYSSMGNYNVAIGYESGYAGTANTTGSNNTFVGYQAQANAANYTNSTALGNGAIITASNQMVFGDSAVTNAIFSGTGAITLPNGTDAQRPTGAGGMFRYNTDATPSDTLEYYDAETAAWVTLANAGGSLYIDDLLDSETDYVTDHNMWMGSGAGAAILAGGQYNLAIGELAGDSITTGDNNIAIGYNSLSAISTSAANVAIGRDALKTLSGVLGNNIAIGKSALALTNSEGNIAIGAEAASQNGGQTSVVAIGNAAMYTGGGDGSIGIGYLAGYSSNSASRFIAIGSEAMRNNSQGQSNVAIGAHALRTNVNGNQSVALGYYAMRYANSTAVSTTTYNTAVGYQALMGSITAADNIGTSNTALGHSALSAVTSGSGNTALGVAAGNAGTAITTGSNNTLLGYNTQMNAATYDNSTALGQGAIITASNQMVFGDSSVTNAIFSGTGAITLPNGTDAQRPTGAGGMFRYNTTSTPSDTLEYYDAETAAWVTLANAGGTSTVPLSSITAATAANTIANDVHMQNWNWALTGATDDAFTFGETTAATNGTGTQSILKASTLATSTAVPFMATNLGAGLTARFNDDTGDTDTTPVVIDASGNLAIGSDTARAALDVNGGDFLTTGTYSGAGTAPVTGAGTRMFFDVTRAAFRAGYVDGTQWDTPGNYSFASGYATTADGDFSTAMGSYSTASGLTSTAMGDGTTASGLTSTAMGGTTTASSDYSTAMGTNTVASGMGSTAMGDSTTASGASSTAMGGSTIAAGDWSTAMGREATVSGTGDGSMAIGLTKDAVGTAPLVSGAESLGIFLNGQSGVDFTAANTVGIFGGNMVIDPANPATQLTARGVIDVGASTGAIVLPSGTTVQQPASPVGGMFRYNTTSTPSDTLEYYDAETTSWKTVANAGGSLYIDDLLDAESDYVTDNNLFMGSNAGVGVAVGAKYNLAIGQNALDAVLTSAADSNTALGYNTLTANTSGTSNTAVGASALSTNLTGSNNTATGKDALLANSNGDNNVANGVNALVSNSSGQSNVAVGVNALRSNTSGGYNTAVGLTALYPNVSGSESTAIGYEAMRYANSSAVLGITYNTALGAYALRGSTTAGNNTGIRNTAIGHSALLSNTSGYSNTAIGHNVLTNNTTGYQNVGVGSEYTMRTNTTGNGNTAVGYAALYSNSTGASNTAVGSSALESCTGTSNVAVGSGAMQNSTIGNYNSALGYGALLTNVGGDRSTAVGYGAMRYANSLSTAFITYNTAIGYQALLGSSTAANNTGTSNTALGYQALLSVTSGSNNIAIGDRAADALSTGSNNITIGSNIDAVNAAGSNQLNIGDTIYGDLSSDYVGIGNNAPSVALDVTGDIEYTGTITDVSDIRLKKDITPLSQYGNLLDKIDEIDTYSFRMIDDKKGSLEFGVMAQELEKIFPELVRTAPDEMGTKSVNYVGLIPPMIEAMKKLHSENRELLAQINHLKDDNIETRASLDELSNQVDLLNRTVLKDVHKASFLSENMNALSLLIGGICGFLIRLCTKRSKQHVQQ